MAREILIGSAWTQQQVYVQQWMALPPRSRKPRTQRQLAAELGIHERTISDWKAIPGFRDAVTAYAQQWLHDDLAEVYRSLAARAKAGSYMHQRLFFELLGLLVHRAEIRSQSRVEHVDYSAFSTDQIRELLTLVEAGLVEEGTGAEELA